jgi:hypothetical protein
MDIWYWSPGKSKLHVSKDFGRHLIKNNKMKWAAVYSDQSGRVVAYDFIIDTADRDRMRRLFLKFEAGNSSENNGENGAYPIGEIAGTGFESLNDQ